MNKEKSSFFIWSEKEALSKQHEQTARSACGASAMINVLNALDYKFDHDIVCSQVKINTRIPEYDASTTTLLDYLRSRSVAGMNANELIDNINRITSDKITGRLFPFNFSKTVNIVEWLANWMKKGAVPVALLNLQQTPYDGITPDAWHHQMIYGCQNEKVHLTNPVEDKSLEKFLKELSSESILLIRHLDIIKRYLANKEQSSNEMDIFNEETSRWSELDVVKQIKEVIDIYSLDLNDVKVNMKDAEKSFYSHIRIPASYVPGITLFTYKDSSLYKEVMEAEDF